MASPVGYQTVDLQRADTAAEVFLAVAGDVDLLTVGRFRDGMADALADAGGRPVILDLRSVSFLGSAGLAALDDARRAAQAHATPLRLVADAAGLVMRALRLTLLDTALSSYPTVQEARDRSGSG
jgi:anti-anti-sigma factor